MGIIRCKSLVCNECQLKKCVLIEFTHTNKGDEHRSLSRLTDSLLIRCGRPLPTYSPCQRQGSPRLTLKGGFAVAKKKAKKAAPKKAVKKAAPKKKKKKSPQKKKKKKKKKS